MKIQITVDCLPLCIPAQPLRSVDLVKEMILTCFFTLFIWLQWRKLGAIATRGQRTKPWGSPSFKWNVKNIMSRTKTCTMVWPPVKFWPYSSPRHCSERLASRPVQLELKFIAAQCHCLYAAEPRSLCQPLAFWLQTTFSHMVPNYSPERWSFV